MQILSIGNNYIPAKKISFTAKITPTANQWNDLRVFSHHIYEYKKGLRNLILTTEKTSNQNIIENRLKKEGIDYLIQEVDKNKINVFFGKKDCIGVIKAFNQPRLNEYTPEQDFILGTLLGYDKIQGCQRYLKKLTSRKCW